MFAVLIDSYPDCALQKLEEVSWLIRNGHDISKFLNVGGLDRDYRACAADLAAYIDKTKPLFTAPVADEDGNVPERAAVTQIQDLLSESKLFNWAGVGFGQQESYLLQRSL